MWCGWFTRRGASSQITTESHRPVAKHARFGTLEAPGSERLLFAIVCSVAVIAASTAPMASGSTLTRDGPAATNNVITADLHAAGGIAAGTILGMENFLAPFRPR